MRTAPILLALGVLSVTTGGCGTSGGQTAFDASDASKVIPDTGGSHDSSRDVVAARPEAGARREGSTGDALVGQDAGTNDAHVSSEASADARPDAPVPDALARDSATSTCSDGTPIAYTRIACSGPPGSVPAPLASAITQGDLGEIVSLSGLDEADLPCFPVRVCVPATAPLLIFSDDPESPSSDGVLYADQLVAGKYRAYVYHTNAGSSLRKFPVVLLNQGTTTVHATVTAKGIAGPSQDYVDVGKQALLRWFMSQGMGTIETVDVPAGERVLLDPDLDGVDASTNDLVHAILDFAVDGPVKLSVVSVLSSEDATTVTSGLSLLPPDGRHTRGSFPGADLEIESIGSVDGAGPRHLRLGGGVTDEALTGTDYVDGTSVTLDGNYGVAYALRLTFSGAASGLVLSPQGGDWGGAANLGAGASILPTAQDSLGTQTDAIVLGAYQAASVGTLTMVSAGGSNLPVDLVSVPTQ